MLIKAEAVEKPASGVLRSRTPTAHRWQPPVVDCCRVRPRRRAKRGSRSPLATRNRTPWTQEGASEPAGPRGWAQHRELLFFFKLEEIAAETAGRRHGRGTSVSGLQPLAVTSRESQVQPSQAVSRAACWGPPCTAIPCLSMPGPVHRNVSSRLWMKSGAQCCISIA